MALGMMRQAVEDDVPVGVELADAAYGSDTAFRPEGVGLGLDYAAGVQSSLSLWRPRDEPLKPKPTEKTGRPPNLLRRSAEHKPVSARELALRAGEKTFRQLSWREGTGGCLKSRLRAMRVRRTGTTGTASPTASTPLRVEWPRGARKPASVGSRICPRTRR